MSIRKIRGIESNFTIISNETINDKLSWSAKGLLVYLCSKPDDWTVSIAQLCNHSALSDRKTGRDGTYSIINELISAGYMQRVQCRANKTGKFANNEYIVSATKIEPYTDLPCTDLPRTANTTLQSKEIYKVNRSTNNNYKKDFDFFWLNMKMRKAGCKKKALNAFVEAFKRSEYTCSDLFAKRLISDTTARYEAKQFAFNRTLVASYLNRDGFNDESEIKFDSRSLRAEKGAVIAEMTRQSKYFNAGDLNENS